MSAWRRTITLSAGILVVGVAALGLHQAGTGALAPPPLDRPGSWLAWLAARDPVVAAVAILRLLALVMACYLLATSLLGIVLRLAQARRLIRLADRVTLPALRRLLVATAGVTLVSGLGSPSVLARGVHPPAVVTSAPHPLVTAAAPPTTVAPPEPSVTMRLLSGPEIRRPAPGPPVRSTAPTIWDGGSTWRVRPGDCFWTIAKNVLAETWGRSPTDAEVVPYWRTLVDENRSRLHDRSNPHLIFPGQIFAVPAPPPRAA